jgi:hypothetical protein
MKEIFIFKIWKKLLIKIDERNFYFQDLEKIIILIYKKWLNIKKD